MLETLKIRNIATIDSAEIRFRRGLNILSGETGAGKSIIIEAISLLLGSRANTDLLRAGCDEAVVEGLFDTSGIPWIQARLDQHGVAPGDGTDLLIKRIVSRSGKHRIYVNGELATLTLLQKLCVGLVDICSQHEHQSLNKPDTQLELLDRYAGLEVSRRAISTQIESLRALHAENERLRENETERSKRQDFLKFQIEELRSADLSPGEDDRLSAEKKLLQSGEVRVQNAEAVRQILEAEDTGVLSALRTALLKLRALNQLDDSTHSMHDALERAVAEVEDVELALNRYQSAVNLDPERLTSVQDRLALLADLRRKYGPTIEEMLATLTQLDSELQSIGNAAERLQGISGELAQARAELVKTGRKLSQSRRKFADVFSDSVTAELKELKMGDAKLMIEFSMREDPLQWPLSGPDLIQFVVQTNRGEPAKPIGKIASGGELSRLMLAIRRVISDQGGIGVYLFDEIDTGMGGQTAFQVGKKLKSVAAYNQVICITHLAQVASFADHHLVVRKESKGKRTLTEVIELSAKERKEELARMLGGPELTKKSLENAAELLNLAR